MYLHIGTDYMINADDVIAVMDMETSTTTERGRQFLNRAEKEQQVVNVSIGMLPKSYVVIEKKGRQIVYVSPIAVSTILKRIEENRSF